MHNELTQSDIKKMEDSKTDADSKEERDANVAKPEYYTVKAGDTLTSICRQIYGSTDRLKELKECNNLENADDLRVDQKLLLP